MVSHTCGRCGYETSCFHGRWWDRHPAAAVCAGVFIGLPALYTVAGVILAYPWFFVPVLVVVCAFVVDRRMRRRAAIAARADWEHRALMARTFLPEPVKRQVKGLTDCQRLADHWSRTEPMRTV
ncbi:hypothetical protein [Mycobacterium avium]|uniref:hypothetical protein n=1 Tax=Mycobacterium avium TaxID=1764 RepID=UPI001CC5971D|nr:hypothetical protein [Mycobacterium avium]MBZ4622079.1 hypothetical protein [Mycobacterium avium subsp. hominissuis]